MEIWNLNYECSYLSYKTDHPSRGFLRGEWRKTTYEYMTVSLGFLFRSSLAAKLRGAVLFLTDLLLIESTSRFFRASLLLIMMKPPPLSPTQFFSQPGRLHDSPKRGEDDEIEAGPCMWKTAQHILRCPVFSVCRPFRAQTHTLAQLSVNIYLTVFGRR
jgi:hypothetical protein